MIGRGGANRGTPIRIAQTVRETRARAVTWSIGVHIGTIAWPTERQREAHYVLMYVYVHCVHDIIKSRHSCTCKTMGGEKTRGKNTMEIWSQILNLTTFAWLQHIHNYHMQVYIVRDMCTYTTVSFTHLILCFTNRNSRFPAYIF